MCALKVIFSVYMYMHEYSGFLRKLGQLQVCSTERLHRFHSNVIYLLGLMCKSSVQKLNNRWNKIFASGSNYPTCGVITCPECNEFLQGDTNYPCLFQVDKQIDCESKIRSGYLHRNYKRHEHLNISPEASEDTWFVLDLSQVVEYDKIHTPAPNLETCEDNSYSTGKSISISIVTKEYFPSELPLKKLF